MNFARPENLSKEGESDSESSLGLRSLSSLYSESRGIDNTKAQNPRVCLEAEMALSQVEDPRI